MKASNTCFDLIKKWESLHDGNLKLIGLQPKMCPSSVWTEGYGHAIRDDKGKFIKGSENEGKAYTFSTIRNETEAMAVLKKDVEEFETIVNNRLKVAVSQNRFDALVSHTFNTGGSDTLFKLINSNAPTKEIYEWWTKHYITAEGVKMKGLVNRRMEEFILSEK